MMMKLIHGEAEIRGWMSRLSSEATKLDDEAWYTVIARKVVKVAVQMLTKVTRRVIMMTMYAYHTHTCAQIYEGRHARNPQAT